ncbi:hypothetical protein [Microbacterium sp. Leaf203]|uniref:hypothetical protein n=1 Tax=Microbacterium sp. Leaf203 TaxID=1735677 RepID=UPI0007000445|nr:hypothetical protein [Microbacterium sp. Leaf203]KQM36862.1 hypothetical protein ASE56_10635 [Microbacterium sp. Leaf203]
MTVVVRFMASASGGFVALAAVAVLTATPGAPLTVLASLLGIPLAWLAAPRIVHSVRERFATAHRAMRCRTILAAVPEDWLRLATGADVDDLSLPARRAQQLVVQYVSGVPGEMVGVRV